MATRPTISLTTRAARLAAFLVAVAPVPIHADTLQLRDDVFVNENNPAASMAIFSNIVVRNTGANRDRVGLARFDLATLPAGVTGDEIARATLRIWVRSINTPGTFGVHRVTSAWDEDAVTWNTQPVFDALPEGSTAVGSGPDDDADEWMTVDVTALVQDWVDGILPNNGVALVGDPLAPLQITLDAKETVEEGHGMQIEIALETNAATLCDPGELLDGDGSCVPSSAVGVDTSAATECAANQFLDGSGACVTANPLGDITSVAAAGGSGITGGAASGSAVLDTDVSVLQRRVSASCPAGQSIRVVNVDGTVVCEADTDTDTNAATLCAAGRLLNGDGSCDALNAHDHFGQAWSGAGATGLAITGNTAQGDSAIAGVYGAGLLAEGHLAVQGAVDHTGRPALDVGGLEIGVLGISDGPSASDNAGIFGFGNARAGWFRSTATGSTAIFQVDTVDASGGALDVKFEVEADGDVEVGGQLTADGLTYSAPRTGYYSVGDGDFHSGSGDAYRTSLGQGGSYLFDAGSGWMVAGLHLPHGAVITNFKVVTEDTAGGGDLSVTISRRAHTATVFSTLASVATAGTPGIQTLNDGTIGSPTVNNDTYAYHVRAFSSGWPGNSSLRIKGAVVEYTVSEAQ